MTRKGDLLKTIDLMRDSERNGDLVITMLVDVVKDIRTVGANTQLRRQRVKNALEFAAAHLGVEA